jgi:hypothetical protein
MTQLYSEQTVATAVAVQDMNTSLVVVILSIILLLAVLRMFFAKPRKDEKGEKLAKAETHAPAARKLPRSRVVLRRAFRSAHKFSAAQCRSIRQRYVARKALREANKNDTARQSDILPTSIGDYTPIAPNGKPWDQYDEPAFSRKGVQLSF